jgi:hypothetical protein
MSQGINEERIRVFLYNFKQKITFQAGELVDMSHCGIMTEIPRNLWHSPNIVWKPRKVSTFPVYIG